MNPFDKDTDKNQKDRGDEPGKKPSKEKRKESKLVHSYNLTYDQIKKQEMGDSGEEPGLSEGGTEKTSPPEQKKERAGGRFSGLVSQFKKIDLEETIDKIKKQPEKKLPEIMNWFRKHKMMGSLIIVLVGMGSAWFLSKLFFGEKKKTRELQGVAVVDIGTQVKVLKTTKTDFSDSILAMGSIKGFAQVNLGFQISGVVSVFYFREGDEIKSGQVIVQLDPQEQLLKYEQAQVKYENAQSLYDLGAIIPLKLKETRLEMELAQTELAKTAIVAPSDGILGSRDVEVGSMVNPSMKVATFLDVEDVFAEAGIMEREINKVVLGQSVKINVDAYPDLDFGGTVTNISPMVKGKSKTLNVKVQIANPYRLLLPGMFVRVRVKIFETKNAIIIPRPALKKVKGAYHVFVVNPDNKAEFKTVKLGYVTTDNVQITEGLKEGELVVVEGMEELKDSAKVQVMEYQSTSF
ncbi:efflux RND transporter periplasmic adaptor subunit [bacterium]|nr:efflux RND transporter periplasmic adaptor subunit [bacterium]